GLFGGGSMALRRNELILLSVGLGCAAVALAGGIRSVFRPADIGGDSPNGNLWMCTDTKCGNQFTMTVQQLAKYQKEHFGQPVKCPKCGATAVPAEKCQQCGNVYPLTAGADTPCPKDGHKPSQN